jgi:arylsulfatase A-like enzyme
MPRLPLISILILCTIFVACSGPAPEAPEAEPAVKPHVILISLDTVRRDRAGATRNGEPLTPNLDAFAESAVVFEDAFAQIPFTLPSHLSMFTSLYPDVHGVERDNASLGEHVPTLPELLKAGGYRTLGLVANIWMKADFGFARGFDHYLMMPFELTFSGRLNRTLGELLDRPESQGPPLFLFLHYFDAHSDFHNVAENTLPYYAPPEFLDALGVSAGSRDFCTPAGECATDYLLAANRDPSLIDEAQLAQIMAMYDEGIRYLDRDLGELFADLQARGLWEQSLIIVTADHGEQFREHGELIHNQAYTEDLAVPLMIKLPGGRFAGERRAGLAETVDLLPTILDLTGLGIPAGGQGHSLMPLIEEGTPVRDVALGRHKSSPRRYAVRDERFTLVHDLELGTSELYDRDADPEELINVAVRYPDDTARLRERLQTLVADNAAKAAALASAEVVGTLLTEEEAEQLRAIGYTD